MLALDAASPETVRIFGAFTPDSIVLKTSRPSRVDREMVLGKRGKVPETPKKRGEKQTEMCRGGTLSFALRANGFVWAM